MSSPRLPDADEFERFVLRIRPALVEALVATYGPVDGREAAGEALSWAWEHWDRVAGLDRPVGYLYRVGQSSTRRFVAKPPPARLVALLDESFPRVEPGLLPALHRLPVQQRTVVLLVHGFEWRQSEVAELLGVNPSTVRAHLDRALARLRHELEVHHVGDC